MSRLNMTVDDLNREYNAFKGDRQNDLRFGQYIWNKYGVTGVASFPELFYAERKKAAYDIAFNELNLDLFGA